MIPGEFSDFRGFFALHAKNENCPTKPEAGGRRISDFVPPHAKRPYSPMVNLPALALLFLAKPVEFALGYNLKVNVLKIDFFRKLLYLKLKYYCFKN